MMMIAPTSHVRKGGKERGKVKGGYGRILWALPVREGRVVLELLDGLRIADLHEPVQEQLEAQLFVLRGLVLWRRGVGISVKCNKLVRYLITLKHLFPQYNKFTFFIYKNFKENKITIHP